MILLVLDLFVLLYFTAECDNLKKKKSKTSANDFTLLFPFNNCHNC